MRTLKPNDITITVYGRASKKIVKTITVSHDLIPEISLMDFLRENGITIASSCGGVGTCLKCVVNDTVLSCQLNLKNFIEGTSQLVEISYL